MSGSTHVDTAELRAAAGQLDALFDEASSQLCAAEAAVTDSGAAWPEAAGTAFGLFASSLESRRESLQRTLAEMSTTLVECAHRYDGQDGATTTRLDALTPTTSLDL
ncbi:MULTISPECIES: type VII secretion target [unclassified Rhodococcus (in: high G+C Gram-positive bacteria)]|uniref:type VII secretion target n=1 Tax=unclassified Rhodococcus (in: high G+C Gram-positive bacteria) TaxID=192944 RepID=UPI001639D385|nr:MULTISPECIES: type VII secretion target [unclassified Rhodococcus (in: high G+C Gram-positive bacteria)]MBC2639626.1 WXG100 family type VII secretion target [Rhodococcus sp. 3A]MBC2895628.1 WXG100 family type VII secretion target [Rhodococcus sp. 4CII]